MQLVSKSLDRVFDLERMVGILPSGRSEHSLFGRARDTVMSAAFYGFFWFMGNVTYTAWQMNHSSDIPEDVAAKVIINTVGATVSTAYWFGLKRMAQTSQRRLSYEFESNVLAPVIGDMKSVSEVVKDGIKAFNATIEAYGSELHRTLQGFGEEATYLAEQALGESAAKALNEEMTASTAFAGHKREEVEALKLEYQQKVSDFVASFINDYLEDSFSGLTEHVSRMNEQISEFHGRHPEGVAASALAKEVAEFYADIGRFGSKLENVVSGKSRFTEGLTKALHEFNEPYRERAAAIDKDVADYFVRMEERIVQRALETASEQPSYGRFLLLCENTEAHLDELNRKTHAELGDMVHKLESAVQGLPERVQKRIEALNEAEAGKAVFCQTVHKAEPVYSPKGKVVDFYYTKNHKSLLWPALRSALLG
ncbi:hypothetical protein HYU12_03765 [Candidatus Woesearchaeota archaeon]|nr:hypothetical protein [Candidatus Woesearchaeota archaeon]